MTSIHRDGSRFEVVFRRSGAVHLRRRDGDTTIDHGEVCRWKRLHTPTRVYVQLHGGIYPARVPEYLPHPDGTRPTRRDAPGCVVDRWLACKGAPHPQRVTEAALEAVLDRGLVYARGGAVVYESILEREYPAINIPLLCDLFADNLGEHQAVIAAYLHAAEPAAAAATA